MATTTKTKETKKETKAEIVKDEFVVFTTGGKQYKTRIGEIVKIEKILGDHKVGGKVSFDQVLLTDGEGKTIIGTPFIKGAKVEAEITDIGRDPKVTVIHYKQKSKYFKKYGHRQPFFKVAIKAIA